MNFPTGVGAGIVLGACAGKVFRPQIERELEALHRDWDFESKLRLDGYTSLDAWLENEKSCPSMYRRVMNVYYAVRRGIVNIRYAPRSIRYTIQRAHRGWGDNDVWNADTYIVDVLIGMIKQYQRDSFGYPADMMEDEWDDAIQEILWGLRQYQLYWERSDELHPDDYATAREHALAALKRSFELLGEHLPGIWV